MNRISSHWTFFYKRIFPVVWFGFIAMFVCGGARAAIAQNEIGDLLPVLAILLWLAVGGYLMMRWLVFDLVDEVWDFGEMLVVHNKGRKRQILLADCMNVSYRGFVNPPRITLTLRINTPECGTKIAFIPPFRLFPYTMPPIARDLIARIDAARRSSDT